jgi:hypothetical protein
LLEQETGFNGQRRVIVLHTKKGRTHAHLVYERYDHEKGIMKSDSFSRLAQDRARQAMEIALNHQRTPERNRSRPDMKKCLTDLWNSTASGKEFIQQASMHGYTIAAGLQRHPFIVVDKEGRSFDLVRQLENVRTREVRNRLKDEKLVGEKQAIEQIRQQQKGKHVLNDNSTKDMIALMFAESRSDIIKDGSDRREKERQCIKFGLMMQSANDIEKHQVDAKTMLAEAFAENKESEMKDNETSVNTEKRRKEILERLRQNKKKEKSLGYEF